MFLTFLPTLSNLSLICQQIEAKFPHIHRTAYFLFSKHFSSFKSFADFISIGESVARNDDLKDRLNL